MKQGSPYLTKKFHTVLLVCLNKDKTATSNILIEAYGYPAHQLIQKNKWVDALDFADAYQEAWIRFLKISFKEEKEHTAQLFSIFFSALRFSCLDQLRKKGQWKRSDDISQKKDAPEGV